MKKLRPHAVFWSAMILAGLGFVGELWWLSATVRRARESRERVAKLLRESRFVLGSQAANQPNERARMETDLGSMRIGLEELKVRLRPLRVEAAAVPDVSPPAQSSDGYFDIATFIERMRARAALRNVQLNADERFGFARYAHTGPETKDLTAVVRERRVVEYLLLALFDAEPQKLLGLHRERPKLTAGAMEPVPSSGRMVSDYFDWETGGAAEPTKLLETFAIRVSFVGRTLSLRSLLNKLADFEVPLVVRMVEVEPAPLNSSDRRAVENDAKVAEPLVASSLSRFTVTVELITLNESNPGRG